MPIIEYHSLTSAQTPAFIKVATRWLTILFFVIPVLILFLPWQQNVTATGSVIALTPSERPQVVNSPISGVIYQWHVQEGSKVKAGDLLVEVRDVDVKFKERLTTQRDLQTNKLNAKQAELNAYELQLNSLKAAKSASVAAAGYKLSMANQTMLSVTEAVASTQAQFDAATAQKVRLTRLYDEGLVSKRDLELAERDAIVANRSLSSAKANLSAAQAEVSSAQAAMQQVSSTAEASINSISAIANKIKSEIADSRSELTSSEVNLARQAAQMIYAPNSGTVFRVFANGSAQVVSQGQNLLTVVPEVSQKAVELLVSSRDMPLVQTGKNVRLEFAGWPAMQVTGWPGVSIGTFLGKISFVDATDDGTGFFRVVVVPKTSEQDWPSSTFLRQGVSARGWILLERVSIGFEVWRILNGFPPRVNKAILSNEVKTIKGGQ